ncbi:hypothetical protein [Actinomadura miaoliensis]|uniref:Holin n=1 Tax=Actinomadura miaoliensis TaxID=430685 RepID=A0ABP7V5Y3_9ACTN
MSAPVETKVKAASLSALAAAFVVSWVVVKAPVLEGASEVLQAAVVGVITSASTATAGWLARHTPRRM